MLASLEREDRMFGAMILKRLISVAERLYKKYPQEMLIEIIDNFYQFIEKYDVNKRNL